MVKITAYCTIKKYDDKCRESYGSSKYYFGFYNITDDTLPKWVIKADKDLTRYREIDINIVNMEIVIFRLRSLVLTYIEKLGIN